MRSSFLFLFFWFSARAQGPVRAQGRGPGSVQARLSADGRRNILGIEGLLWGENLVSDQRTEYMLLPKLLGTAERAWAPDPSWGTGSSAMGAADIATGSGVGGGPLNASYDSAWNVFLNICGKRVLPRLSRLDGGYAYRIPPPGVVFRDGRIWANCALPGLTIRYTADGSEPTVASTRYNEPIVYKSGTRFRIFDPTGRGSRSVTVKK